ncbi:MAG: YgiQ family radical SAM protein [Candidatus Methanoplasma sp.]|jgi:uncharacterized radical SAM protein YgiQ|nr:YgiQ family radical SAM protein [Candidatus Methanoplasma sp.]
MFLPTSLEEARRLGWDRVDVAIVSGDAYIDSPYNGAAVIGRWLTESGFRAGIISQPRMDSGEDIGRLGEPSLFWSVTAGSVDSMVANYTPTGKFRKDDDFTPGGANDRRPDRAAIAYSNLIRRHFKGRPIALGGIEASLRRVAHYDAWSDSVRRSVLFDAKADFITYGMAELSNLELARALRDGGDARGIRGTCVISREARKGYAEMPSFERCRDDPGAFLEAFRMFRDNGDPATASGLCQAHGDRFLVQNPPSRHLSQSELDRIHSMGYERSVHPRCAARGPVRAMETIKNSVTTHRGCYGGCSFCAISAHQGRCVVSRSEESIIAEIEAIASSPGFNGIIYDLGGPTANMYGIECPAKPVRGACRDRECLYPSPCRYLPIDHSAQIRLLERASSVPGVKRAFVSSGVRHDMVVADRAHGREYVDALVGGGHVSGQLKIAPEHSSEKVLGLMGKPGPEALLRFKEMFDDSARCAGRDLFLTYYLMAAHPGCTEEDMRELGDFARRELRTNPEQVQIFTPTPSTASTAMYHARRNPRDGSEVRSERSPQMKQRQKEAVTRGRARDGRGRG